jgi:ATP-dependent DNA helicase RecQ
MKDQQELIVLTSPPASGKTFWISSLHSALNIPLLVISPLRALADECKTTWGDSIKIVTPEEWMIQKNKNEVVIIDEFHLFFYWGDSFRPLLWEAFYELAINSRLVVLLTATLSKEMKSEIALYHSQFDSIHWCDFGNQKLKFTPDLYLKAPSRKWLLKTMENENANDGTKLVFCKYREEVFGLEKKLTEEGYNCITCVGGQSKMMALKLSQNPCPDFILSTTVLSHGVNLPSIRRIYFLYKVNNLDFWIQMVARGGRKGESFEVFAMEKPYQLKWNWWVNLIQVIFIGLRYKFSRRALLKAWLHIKMGS